MKNVAIKDMLDLSNKLFDLHSHEWMQKTPESNIFYLAWLVGEVGEVIDIVKKKGPSKIMRDEKTRTEMLEEIVDCYFYLADIINRYGYTPEEFSKMYLDKMNYNLKRDFRTSKTKKDKKELEKE